MIAVDLLELNPNTVKSIESNSQSAEFHCIQGDFTSDVVKQQIIDVLPPKDNDIYLVDCIISDMAANFTGDKLTDSLRTMNLCEDAMMFAAGSDCFDEIGNEDGERDTNRLLREGGSILFKFFKCGQDNEKDIMTAARNRFKYSTIVKPAASRKESAEIYLFASGFTR